MAPTKCTHQCPQAPKSVKPITDVTVLVLPLPAQGHLNQLLHLATLLASRGLTVHYATSSSHLNQVLDRYSAQDHHPRIRFHAFPLPPYASPPPDPRAPVQFPAQLLPAFFAADAHFTAPLASLLATLAASHRRVVVVHDSTMSSAAVTAAATFKNAETYPMHTVSALCLLHHFNQGRNTAGEPFPAAGLAEISVKDCFTDDFLSYLARQHAHAAAGKGRLLNTLPLVEGPFIEALRREPRWLHQKVFPVGPLNSLSSRNKININRATDNECLRWLDAQPPRSVVYVSFGTTAAMTEEQTKEISAGLAQSGQRFLWVVRDADRGDMYATQKSKEARGVAMDVTAVGNGVVVRGWAPQVEVLGHRATAAFVSHCGWNSCMESLSCGVAMVAWPLHSDQPANAVLVVEVLGCGVWGRRWGRRGETVGATEVAAAVRGVMEGEEGRRVREKARVLGEKVREGMEVGGGAKEGLDSFVEHITR